MKHERHIFLQEIKTIEWYDGPVQGIVKDEIGAYYYRGLLSIKQDLSECIFAIIQIDHDKSSDLITLVEQCENLDEETEKRQLWNRLGEAVSEVIKSIKGPILLEKTGGVSKKAVFQKVIDVGNIKLPRMGMIESINRDDYEKWEAILLGE